MTLSEGDGFLMPHKGQISISLAIPTHSLLLIQTLHWSEALHSIYIALSMLRQYNDTATSPRSISPHYTASSPSPQRLAIKLCTILLQLLQLYYWLIYPTPNHRSPLQVTPWPKPHAFTNGSMTAAIALNLPLQLITTSQSGILQRGFTRLQTTIASNLQPAPKGMDSVAPSANLNQIQVTLQTDDETLNDKTNDSYSLQVTNTHIVISAPTVYGALHGFESLAQLAEVQASGTIVIRGVPWNINGRCRSSFKYEGNKFYPKPQPRISYRHATVFSSSGLG